MKIVLLHSPLTGPFCPDKVYISGFLKRCLMPLLIMEKKKKKEALGFLSITQSDVSGWEHLLLLSSLMFFQKVPERSQADVFGNSAFSMFLSK